ncbi:MAG: PQQ-binding-like beta-propeller repeat protein [Candidatus Aminicenantes bacterium]|nr:PQQ-binding-like beta-propeller repeat protein [Candidatus Aminicenantes bacterium]
MASATKKRLFRSASLLISFLVFCPIFSAQSVRFAVISDTHIGAGTAASALESVVAAVNSRLDIEFVVVAGDISEKGRLSEFVQAKKILDGLKVPYYAIPGNHDSHWIGHGLTNFRNTWPEDRFYFQKGNDVFIGLNSWDTGHLAPEDITWLEGKIAAVPLSTEIFLFVHYPPETIDNWFKAHNLLKDRRAHIISGHVHRTQLLTSGGISVATARASIAKNNTDTWGFLQVEETPDRIDFLEVNGEEEPVSAGSIIKSEWKPVGERPVKPFQSFGANILWRKDLGTHLMAPLVVHKDRIFAADISGRITSFDLKGDILWTYKAGDAIIGRMAVNEDRLWAAGRNGRLSVIDADKGLLIKIKDLGEEITSQLVLINDGPKKRRTLIVATTNDISASLHCIDAETLELLWVNRQAGGMIQTRPLVVSGRVVYGSWDGHVHCLNLDDGRELWTWTENDNFYYSPAGCAPVSDGTNVYVCAPDGFVSSVDLASGGTKWRKAFAAWESLGMSQDNRTLFVKSRLDEFNIVEAGSGRLIRKLQPAHGGGDLMPIEPIEWKGTVLFGAQNGFIYQIDAEYRLIPLIFLGAAGVHTIQSVKGGLFAASNVDGRIVVFEINPFDSPG